MLNKNDNENDTDAASTSTPRRRVAVVGGGVTGLSAAWHLSENASSSSSSTTNTIATEVTLFEAEDRLGGHAYTVPVPLANGSGSSSSNDDDDETVDVDIGFMVYNESNYPNMTKWFEALSDGKDDDDADTNTNKVSSEDSDMSLSVSLDKGNTLEWSSNGGLNGLFAKRGQLFDKKFYSMVQDMTRFHQEAPKLLLLHKEDPWGMKIDFGGSCAKDSPSCGSNTDCSCGDKNWKRTFFLVNASLTW